MPQITIPGKPFGKQRPKIARRRGFNQAMTPDETVNYEVMIKLLSIKAGAIPIDGPIRMGVAAYFKPPKSASKKKREGMLCHKILPTVKPDFDNIAKIVADGLKHLFDDKQVVTCVTYKRYSEIDRVVVMWSHHDDKREFHEFISDLATTV